MSIFETPTLEQFQKAAGQNISALINTTQTFEGEEIGMGTPEWRAASVRWRDHTRGFDRAKRTVAEILMHEIELRQKGKVLGGNQALDEERFSFIASAGFIENPPAAVGIITHLMSKRASLIQESEIAKYAIFLEFQADLLSGASREGCLPDLFEIIAPALYGLLNEYGTDTKFFGAVTFSELLTRFGQPADLEKFLNLYQIGYELEQPYRITQVLEMIDDQKRFSSDWQRATIAELPLAAIPLVFVNAIIRAYRFSGGPFTVDGKVL